MPGMGDIVIVWHVDGILETIAQGRGIAVCEFSMDVIEKTECATVGALSLCLRLFGKEGGGVPVGVSPTVPRTKARPVSPKGEETRTGHPLSAEISIAAIEILNCTFDPKPLYQRYIQVVVCAI